MSLDTEKQFAGNYVRLVNQVRELQGDLKTMTEAFDNSTQLNYQLHGEIGLKTRIIEAMANTILLEFPTYKNIETIITEYNDDIIYKKIAEQKKKAANCESV